LHLFKNENTSRLNNNKVETTELLKKVRRIEIKTKGLSKHLFSGAYHSTFKGRGMSFSEVRGYQFGDDVRNIDWNVTARYNDPFVKVFEEEREQIVMLMVDVSPSVFFGSVAAFKSEVLAELSAVLAFSASANNDKVGLLLFSDTVELFIPPKKGRSHILRIIRELVQHEPQGKGTNLNEALQYLNNVQKKRSITFVLSDFKATNYEAALTIVSRRHDLIGIQLFDPSEAALPQNIGLIWGYDAENGQYRWIDTFSKKERTQYREGFEQQQQVFKNTFAKAGADTICLGIPPKTTLDLNEQFYVKDLLLFFKNR
jgi:uncharacterized protein (DUF58 family)